MKRDFRALVKVTGDLLEEPWLSKVVLPFIETKTQDDRKVVVLVGGGKQINLELGEKFPGYEMDKRYGGRYLGSQPPEVKAGMETVALEVLGNNRNFLERKLEENGMGEVEVVLPIARIAEILCHVDADHFATAIGCNGFNQIIIITHSEESKQEKTEALKRWLREYPGKFQILSPQDIELEIAQKTAPLQYATG